MKYAFIMTEVLSCVFKSPELNCKTFKLDLRGPGDLHAFGNSQTQQPVHY